MRHNVYHLAAYVACVLLAVVASATQVAPAAHAIQEGAGLGASVGVTAEPPTFPDAYEMEYDFSMPYFMVLQPQGFKYHVHVWVDKAADSVRIDFNGGEQQVFFVKEDEFGVYPRKYERVCREYKHGGGPIRSGDSGDLVTDRPGGASTATASGGGASSGGARDRKGGSPALTGPSGLLGSPVLPDMSSGDWESAGTAVIDGQEAVMWRLRLKHEAGEKLDDYYFYVTKDGVPLKFHSVGIDYFKGSHYDEYIYDFTSFKPGPVDPSVFKLPALCNTTKGQEGGSGSSGATLTTSSSSGSGGGGSSSTTTKDRGDADVSGNDDHGDSATTKAWADERHPGALQAAALLPGALLQDRDEAHYFGFSHLAGRSHQSGALYRERLAAFMENKKRIHAHNSAAARGGAGAPRHTLRLNRFADWSKDEFDRVMLPRKWGADRGLVRSDKAPMYPLETFKKTMAREELPDSLDWRGTPADFAVKDQGQCGSCWAFAATGTMEGAWFVHTGSSRSFSEQQLVDCAWDQGPKGCDGGDAQPAFDYVVQAGGIALTQDYPYRGQNGYCKDNSTKLVGRFTGYVQVSRHDHEAVMEALMKHGPLAVGVDADFDFAFYSDGVYHETRCTTKWRKLSHAVVLVGYGTSKDGEDYW